MRDLAVRNLQNPTLTSNDNRTLAKIHELENRISAMEHMIRSLIVEKTKNKIPGSAPPSYSYGPVPAPSRPLF